MSVILGAQVVASVKRRQLGVGSPALWGQARRGRSGGVWNSLGFVLVPLWASESRI